MLAATLLVRHATNGAAAPLPARPRRLREQRTVMQRNTFELPNAAETGDPHACTCSSSSAMPKFGSQGSRRAVSLGGRVPSNLPHRESFGFMHEPTSFGQVKSSHLHAWNARGVSSGNRR